MKAHHRLGIWILIGAPLLGLLAGVGYSHWASVDRITVVAPNKALGQEVARQLRVPPGASILFFPLSRIAGQARNCYRVRDVEVERVSPHELQVLVETRQPFAALAGAADYTVISREGLCLYRAATAPPKLPVLVGLTAQRPALGSQLDPDRVQWACEVLAGASKVGLRDGLRVDLSELHQITVTAEGLTGTLGNVNSLVRKMTVLGRLAEELRGQGVAPRAIDVSTPESPRWST